ncbi:hypothetical protein D9757_005578 [Collybiopsis confluens]|uniref:Major facilitator superfamily (MFS) profile domain-containing protein n=1 Tax=Collybiopsis confluens TaxID=2823264 RepID=A0A8H5HT47_9AGAR|nr:hypothetical protein D9757_005578 [Collybiopsis confluens]
MQDAGGDSMEKSMQTTEFLFIPIPSWLRRNSESPVDFGVGMNIALGLAATFTVSNLYYCQPILGVISLKFGVSEDEASNIPTLVQSGYAAGLLFITPLGDLVQRRQLILGLIACSASLTVGLATTTSFITFEAINFLVGLASVVPQVLVPLAADLAPPNRKASAIAIVWSSLMMGILMARLLSGIITQFSGIQSVYLMAIGVQASVLIGAYLIIPNYPAKDVEGSYISILKTTWKLATTEPLLIINTFSIFLSTACFSAFWITLTFLLLGPPYSYSTLDIGLFGLLGMLGVALAPFLGRLIDRMYPWYSILASVCFLLLFQTILVIGAGLNIAAVIVAALGLDIFRTTIQISLTASSFSIDPTARSRINAVMAVAMPLGQVMGTSASSKIFLTYGWRPCYGLALAWTFIQLILLLVRGPHSPSKARIGHSGGWKMWKTKTIIPLKADSHIKNVPCVDNTTTT